MPYGITQRAEENQKQPIIPATRYKWTRSTSPNQTGWYSINLPGRMEGWVDL